MKRQVVSVHEFERLERAGELDTETTYQIGGLEVEGFEDAPQYVQDALARLSAEPEQCVCGMSRAERRRELRKLRKAKK